MALLLRRLALVLVIEVDDVKKWVDDDGAVVMVMMMMMTITMTVASTIGT